MRYVAAALALAIGAGFAPAAFAQAAAPQPAPAADTPPAAVASDTTPADAPSEVNAATARATHGHTPGDPFEHVNRDIFGFNEGLDKGIVEPTAKGYRAITPKFFRSGVSNFLHNLKSPVIFTNDVLQVEPSRAGTTAGRFVLNTTVGLLGLFDVAKHVGLPPHDEDFGQTLGKWGVGPGPYLMIPFLGPSNLRDLTGQLVDFAMDPITYADFKNDDTARAARFAMDELSARTDAIEAIDTLRQTSIDPYSTTRSLYGQARDSAIANGQTQAADSPESDDALSH